MCAVSLENLADKLIEYVLDNLSYYGEVDEGQMRRIKAMKIVLLERQEGVWEVCIGLGMAEATFSLNGEKRTGALGGTLERLVRQWLSRPFNQEALKSLIKE